jgi:hypothetical protein
MKCFAGQGTFAYFDSQDHEVCWHDFIVYFKIIFL